MRGLGDRDVFGVPVSQRVFGLIGAGLWGLGFGVVDVVWLVYWGGFVLGECLAIGRGMERYVYPPRPKDKIPRSALGSFSSGGYVGQLKFNDSRCVFWFREGSGKVEFWDRHRALLAYDPPASLVGEVRGVVERLGGRPGEWHVLDGGCIHKKHAWLKHQVAVWDVLVLNGVPLLGSSYQERYKLLEGVVTGGSFVRKAKCGAEVDLGLSLGESVVLPRCFSPGEWEGVWRGTVEVANRGWENPCLEGLVLKRLSGRLEPGLGEDNNTGWLAKSRVSTGRHRYSG